MATIKKFTEEDVDRIFKNFTLVDLYPMLSEFINFILKKDKLFYQSQGVTSEDIQAVITKLRLEYELGLINLEDYFNNSNIEFPAFIKVLWKFHDDIKSVEQQLNKL